MLTLEYSVATTRRLVSLTVWLSFVATRLTNLFLVGARFVSLTVWLSLVVTRRLSVLSRGARLVSLTVWLSLVVTRRSSVLLVGARLLSLTVGFSFVARRIVDLFADSLVWQLIAALWRWVARRQWCVFLVRPRVMFAIRLPAWERMLHLVVMVLVRHLRPVLLHSRNGRLVSGMDVRLFVR
jgi:hypothetical protein